MKLSSIIKNVKVTKIIGNIDVEIDTLSQSAQKEVNNGLLFCYKGVKYDTHDFASTFKANGYVALIVEREVNIDLPQVVVKSTRKVMTKMCNNFFHNESKKLHFIGVTGTNGKTTTTSIIYQILSNADKRTALVGTSGVFYLDVSLPPSLTTPDTVDFFYLIDTFYKAGIEYVVMEVSAHALSLSKLSGIKFDVSIFTNITQDHLDYFGNMGNYSRAKLKLFSRSYSKFAIINTDDRYGYMFSHILSIPFTTYGISSPAQNFDMDITCNIDGTHFLVNSMDTIFDITTPIICHFNVYNILASITTCLYLGIDSDIIYKTISHLNKIKGRMNVYALDNGAYAVIDYAHTPDGLEQALKSLRPITSGRLISLFGCGGDRDRLKRPKMGYIASMLSDFVYVTTDNPRTENRDQIIAQIVDGMRGNNFTTEPDRETAIHAALDFIKSGDTLLIAGKGCEDYIDIGGHKIPYSDEQVLKEYIERFGVNK